MAAFLESQCQLTNSFAATFDLSVDELMPLSRQARTLAPGLPGLYEARHKFSIEISELIARLSYRDYLVVHSVLTSSIDRLKQSVTESAIPATKPKASGATGGLLIDKVSFKTDQMSLWLLDDFQDTGFPLVRATFSDVVLDHALQSCPMTGMASLKLACDYFNQRVFGWEPLIEPWNLQWLSWQWHASKSKLGIDIRSDNTSTLDLNLTQAFLQQAIQFSGRWTAIKEALDKDFRSACSRARSDHLPYMLKNDTGSDLLFTTAVADVESARVENRKPTVRWSKVAAGEQCSFAFPTRRLTFARDDSESRQMIVQVDGWDEISPVNVDSVGTYFRVARFASSTKQSSLSRVSNARLVVAVSMDQDGRKVVTVRSALTLVNGLPDPIEIHLDNHSNTFFGDGCTLIIPPREARPAPLKYAIAKMGVRPKGRWAVERHETVDWQSNKDVGVTTNRTITCIDANNMCYRMCVSVKREHYPQQQVGHEMLPGHTITFMPPLTVVNLLPTDVEFSLPAYRRFDCIPAGQELLLTAVDMSTSVEFSVSTDLFRTLRSNDGNDRRYDSPEVTKAAAVEGRQLRIRLHDGHQRPLDLFVSISLGKAGAVRMALWVPYWIVNKSGIPLIVKQDASGADDAAGQFDEHESAKDKSSLMFSFANDNCPYQCVVRIGKKYIDSLSPKYSRKFHLTPGVQEIKLALESGNSKIAEVYSIGVEVRQGQGRYKATQVVLFTPRYILANRTAHKLIVAQKGFADKPDKNIAIAPNCHFVWHWASESISIGPDARMLCLKREDVKHWSCPFQIDTLRSFHVNIRDAHDTPRFLRVEIGLSSAVFTVTVTDAEFFPPPIRIENRTDVPIIYQQQSTSNDSQFHLRTICKAQCSVDYAWDDLYAPERLTLQVFENKSQTYDLKVLGQGTPLVYENDMYLRLTTSFKQADSDRVGRGEERELVLEALAQGKVVLNKYNPVDSSRSQLWRLTREGSLENVGLNQRSPRATPMVLDVLDSLAERSNYPLMMKARNPARDHYQLWTFTEDGRLCCRLPDLYVQATAQFDVVLGPSSQASKVASGVPREQHWTKQKQRPGSGRLNVECMHEGPTQVLRITDWADDRRGLARRSTSVSSDSPTPTVEVNVFMDKGVGLSLVNGLFEELVYCRLEGLLIFGKIENGTYSLTGQVMQIQADNQLLTAEQWPVLYCRAKQSDEPNKYEVIPALRLEMRWSPMHNYDAFDCFRAKLRKISVKLDENLLWKLVQFMQMSGAESVQPALLLQPPNTELSRPDTLKARRCYFGTLELGCDMVYLSVLAVAASSLSPELRRLKQQFNVKLVSFENASIPLPPFRQSHYFETFPFLVEAIQKHFAGELQGHALRILGTVDFLGNPMGLAVDVADGLQDLMMEGTVGTLVSNVGYGLSNSISKISSSMADGVGMMTFDEQHETARRKALRYQPTIGSSAALGHLYTGVKGLGVGVIGGLTSIVRNTYDGSRREGVPGAIVGLGTGAIATVTKPMQGIFDLVGGTASAVKEMVGGPSRKARFAESRIRLPRVTRNLQGLLPCYSGNLADAQQQLLRINGYNTNETCLSIEPCSVSVLLKSQMYALICSEQCYIIRQTDDEPNVVTMRISYKNLKEVRAVDDASGRGYLDVIVERRTGHPERLPKIWCSKIEYAKQLCEKILRAKQLHDHSKRTLVVAEDFSLDLI
uniref:Vacuolar protein sorting-associated protein 13 DH-like domain-containing protein n=1 Tax=Plectus sambesii TaxID=2011161 RepID=A0A914WU78_9BILA